MKKETTESTKPATIAEYKKAVASCTTDKQSRKNPLFWDYIRSRAGDFFPVLEEAIEEIISFKKGKPRADYTEINFLDVGCGAGNVLDWVDSYWHLVLRKNNSSFALIMRGIEHDERIAKISEHYGVTTADAMFYKKYKEHDIIHYYRPIKDKRMMCLLEEEIEKEAKVGTVIIAKFKASDKFKKNRGFKKIMLPLSETGYTIIQKIK